MSLDGEFAPLRSLAAKTLASIASAPLALRTTEDTIHSLNALLDRIEADSASDSSIIRSDEAIEHQLGVLVHLCLVSLTKLCDAIEQSSDPEAAPINVEELQHELSLRYNDLASFMGRAFGDTKSMESEEDGSKDQEKSILDAVDRILTDESKRSQETSTIISENKNDHTAVWKHLLVKLKSSGFKSSDMERHKTSIFDRIHETLHLHHAESKGAVQSPRANGMDILNTELPQPVNAQSPKMAFKQHILRQTAARNSNYRPPAASTIYDSEDDDVASVTSEASTLLGPVDGRVPHDNYVLRPPTSPRPVSRTSATAPEPRSPRMTVQVPDEKIVDFSTHPRTPHSKTWSNLSAPSQNRSMPRNHGAAMPRPTSPRERDQRYYPVQQRPSNLRNISMSGEYDYDTLSTLR